MASSQSETTKTRAADGFGPKHSKNNIHKNVPLSKQAPLSLFEQQHINHHPQTVLLQEMSQGKRWRCWLYTPQCFCAVDTHPHLSLNLSSSCTSTFCFATPATPSSFILAPDSFRAAWVWTWSWKEPNTNYFHLVQTHRKSMTESSYKRFKWPSNSQQANAWPLLMLLLYKESPWGDRKVKGDVHNFFPGGGEQVWVFPSFHGLYLLWQCSF